MRTVAFSPAGRLSLRHEARSIGWWPRLLLALSACCFATACTMTRYVLQAGCGQLEIATASRPIPEVLADVGAAPRVRRMLEHVGRVKRFGASRGLSPTTNYDEYAELDRPAAVWVVTAAAPLALVPWTITFPIAGNVPYLGWFDRGDAIAFARELRDEGWDVDVRPASAYSTLGWFDDPVLSTMIGDGPDALGDLVNTILHESVHATIYVPDQSVFNESVATHIGDRLTIEYFDRELGESSAEKVAWIESERRAAERREAMHRAYVELERLYASPLPRAEKLAKKARRLEALRTETGFRRPITNATLVQFRTYNAPDAPFEVLDSACGSSSRAIAALRTLQPADFERPQQKELGKVIARLAARRCASPAPASSR